MATTLHPPRHAAPPVSYVPALAGLGAILALAFGVAVLAPDVTAAGHMTQTPTHYMGLLMANQPWNLLAFMVAPFAIIYLGLLPATLGLYGGPRLGRLSVAVLATYYTVAAVYLVRYAAWPLTVDGGWRGPVDVLAVGGYILTAVPLLVLAALTFGGGSARAQTWWAWIALVVAHFGGMTFGMMATELFWGGGGMAGHVMP